MSKFKSGDKVRRIGCAFGDVVDGGVYTINRITARGWFNLKGYPITEFNTHPYNERHFELYQEQQALTPAEILQCIVEGTQLELKAGSEWRAVVNAHGISAWNMLHSEYRKVVTPVTIFINGKEVPKPMSAEQISTLDRDNAYSIDLLHSKVTYVRAIHSEQYLWYTRPDAQAALDAIKSALKGE